MNAHSVLRVNEVAEQAAYRRAVCEIIRDIQRECGRKPGQPLELVEISEAIGVSLGTISNAVNMKSDLNAIYLARLGKVYGGGFLNPYLNLVDIQAAPLDGSLTSDVLPMVMSLAHKIACARDPEGPGGATEVPQEKKAYLPDLKRVNRRTGTLIAEIEEALA
jgi:hypothetical protein